MGSTPRTSHQSLIETLPASSQIGRVGWTAHAERCVAKKPATTSRSRRLGPEVGPAGSHSSGRWTNTVRYPSCPAAHRDHVHPGPAKPHGNRAVVRRPVHHLQGRISIGVLSGTASQIFTIAALPTEMRPSVQSRYHWGGCVRVHPPSLLALLAVVLQRPEQRPVGVGLSPAAWRAECCGD